MSEAEIAEELGLTFHQVHHALMHGLRKLRDGRAEELRLLGEAMEYERPAEDAVRSDE